MNETNEYERIESELANNDGVMTINMGRLRDAHGAGKLGNIVREGISRQLAQRGIGHFPKDLPPNQWERVRVYKLGSQAERLINAVIEPGEEGDRLIRETLDADASMKLERIREIVEQ